jgi:glycosyltransferase 2 family protein
MRTTHAVEVSDRATEPDEAVTPSSSSRHSGDVARVVVGAAVLAVCLLAVQRDRLTVFETNLFHLLNDLPDQLSVVLGPVMQAGNVIAAPVIGLVLLLLLPRHRRVAVDVTVAGLLAWVAAKFVKDLVERPRPGGLVEDVNRLGSTEGLGFVSGHTAVAAAIAAAASPYLPRRVRRLLWLLPVTVGIARIYYGAHLPLDIVGGAALGLLVAALVHVGFGAPHRVPTLAEAGAALRRTGLEPEQVSRIPIAARGSFPFVANVAGEDVFVKMLDPEPRDRDLIHRISRFLAFRDVRDEASLADAPTQAHREAAMTLLARCRGARVPAIRGVHIDGWRAWVVEDHVAGRTLDSLPSGQVSDRCLDELWVQLATIHSAGVAHRDLVGSNVLVGSEGPWIVDFAHAETATRRQAFDNDAAELLVSTALVVGTGRAVDSVRRVLGSDRLRPVVAELQPLVLTPDNRRRLRRDAPLLLDELRARLSGPTVLESPETGSPGSGHGRRRRDRIVVMASSWLASAGVLAAVAGWSDTVDELGSMGLRWLGLAVVAAIVAWLSDASAVVSSVGRRLAVGRTATLRLRALGRTAGAGRRDGRSLLVSQLRASGVQEADVEAGLHRLGIATISSLVAAGVVALLAWWADGMSLDVPRDAAVFALVAVVALGVELSAARGDSPARESPARESPAGDRPRPASLEMLALSSITEVAAATLAVVAVAGAMGGGQVAAIALVGLAAHAVRLWAPAAGAPGVTTAALSAGLVLVGIDAPAAVAAAIASQLLQLWLPALAGRAVEPRQKRSWPRSTLSPEWVGSPSSGSTETSTTGNSDGSMPEGRS